MNQYEHPGIRECQLTGGRETPKARGKRVLDDLLELKAKARAKKILKIL